MNKYRHPKSSLFLMEIMLNILFFAVLVTICLQLFFKAYNLSEHTTILHRAVTTCTSIAEVYQSNVNGTEMVQSVYPDAIALNSSYLIYFDEDFTPSDAGNCSYRAILELGVAQGATIHFYENNSEEPIYSLSVSSYTPQTIGELKGGDRQ